jgi:crotonobetainyl-CoA:carnitine CoA-transferase CaiB-like acyl-CoA transferase
MDGLAGFLDVQRDDTGRPFVYGSDRSMPSGLLAGHAAASAICAALLGRTRSGQGAFIDASCWDLAVAGDPVVSAWALNGVGPPRHAASAATPKYAPYRTADDRYLMVCVMEPKFWLAFCERLGLGHLQAAFDGDDDLYGATAPQVYDEVAAVVASKPLTAWTEVFAGSGLPVTPILTRAEALESPHAIARGVVHSVSDPRHGQYRVAAAGAVLNGQRPPLVNPAPELGEHTRAILERLGYDDGQISTLRAADVVR